MNKYEHNKLSERIEKVEKLTANAFKDLATAIKDADKNGMISRSNSEILNSDGNKQETQKD